jgi:hypothetical protein
LKCWYQRIVIFLWSCPSLRRVILSSLSNISIVERYYYNQMLNYISFILKCCQNLSILFFSLDSFKLKLFVTPILSRSAPLLPCYVPLSGLLSLWSASNFLFCSSIYLFILSSLLNLSSPFVGTCKLLQLMLLLSIEYSNPFLFETRNFLN